MFRARMRRTTRPGDRTVNRGPSEVQVTPGTSTMDTPEGVPIPHVTRTTHTQWGVSESTGTSASGPALVYSANYFNHSCLELQNCVTRLKSFGRTIDSGDHAISAIDYALSQLDYLDRSIRNGAEHPRTQLTLLESRERWDELTITTSTLPIELVAQDLYNARTTTCLRSLFEAMLKLVTYNKNKMNKLRGNVSFPAFDELAGFASTLAESIIVTLVRGPGSNLPTGVTMLRVKHLTSQITILDLEQVQVLTQHQLMCWAMGPRPFKCILRQDYPSLKSNIGLDWGTDYGQDGMVKDGSLGKTRGGIQSEVTKYVAAWKSVEGISLFDEDGCNKILKRFIKARKEAMEEEATRETIHEINAVINELHQWETQLSKAKPNTFLKTIRACEKIYGTSVKDSDRLKVSEPNIHSRYFKLRTYSSRSIEALLSIMLNNGHLNLVKCTIQTSQLPLYILLPRGKTEFKHTVKRALTSVETDTTVIPVNTATTMRKSHWIGLLVSFNSKTQCADIQWYDSCRYSRGNPDKNEKDADIEFTADNLNRLILTNHYFITHRYAQKIAILLLDVLTEREDTDCRIIVSKFVQKKNKRRDPGCYVVENLVSAIKKIVPSEDKNIIRNTHKFILNDNRDAGELLKQEKERESDELEKLYQYALDKMSPKQKKKFEVKNSSVKATSKQRLFSSSKTARSSEKSEVEDDCTLESRLC